MAIEPVGLRRRLDALEAKNAELSRLVDAMRSEQSRRWVWPRDMFLGRTTASSESSYPTSGNTFQVKLIEGDFLATEGDRDVNEVERGKIVIAHTWPEAYLPYESDVIVKRIRGLGASGRGEYWIEPGLARSRCVLVGDTYGGGTYATRYFNESTEDFSATPTIGIATFGYGALWLHPSIDGEFESAGGEVFEQNNAPTSYLSPYLYLHANTNYRITAHTTWFLESMTVLEAQSYYGKTITPGGHTHAYNDYFVGVALTSVPIGDDTYYRNLLDKTFSVETSVIQSLSGGEAGRTKIPLGRSGIPPQYIESSPLERHASHSGTALLRAPATDDPRELRIQVEVAESNGMPNVAKLRYMQLTIEQVSDA